MDRGTPSRRTGLFSSVRLPSANKALARTMYSSKLSNGLLLPSGRGGVYQGHHASCAVEQPVDQLEIHQGI